MLKYDLQTIILLRETYKLIFAGKLMSKLIQLVKDSNFLNFTRLHRKSQKLLKNFCV